jgi:hypothetical protein
MLAARPAGPSLPLDIGYAGTVPPGIGNAVTAAGHPAGGHPAGGLVNHHRG